MPRADAVVNTEELAAELGACVSTPAPHQPLWMLEPGGSVPREEIPGCAALGVFPGAVMIGHCGPDGRAAAPQHIAVSACDDVPGAAGWQGREPDLEAMLVAVESAQARLTTDTLQSGKRFRVFADGGRRLGVPGDYSAPRVSALEPAYRYLEPA